MNQIIDYNQLFIISGFLIAIPSFILVVVLLQSGKKPLHRIWAIFNLFVGGWGTGLILTGLSQTEQSAIFGWKFATSIGYLIAIIFYHTVLIFTKQQKTLLLYTGYFFLNTFSISIILYAGQPNYAIVTKKFG